MSPFFNSLALLAVAVSFVNAHMSIWTPAMYGVGWKALNPAVNDWDYLSGDPFAPLGPDWPETSDWWFRGPLARSLPPKPGAVELLPAGGKITLEISCHVAWTSYGWRTTPPGSHLDACPGNTGAYHSGDPAANDIDLNLLSGCALGIADVDDISKVTTDNLVIFSVQKNCVKQKVTSFDVPARMPPCTGSKCICGWFWLANNGTGNYYMTAFDCKVTGSPADATPIAPPVDPTWCDRADLAAGRCKQTPGAKRPLYFYNNIANVEWHGNNDRPGYHENYSFNDGAQNDIFLPARPASSSASASAPASSAPASSSASTPPASSSASTPPASSSAPPPVQPVKPPASSSTTTSSAAATSSAPPAPSNLALRASVVGSTSQSGSPGRKVVDGFTDGQLEDDSGDASHEWVSRGQKSGAWVKLSWTQPVTFTQIVLYDRPNSRDQVSGATVFFSDGTQVSTGILWNNGGATYVNLASPKTVTSLMFKVTHVSPSTTDVGLAELQVFNRPVESFKNQHIKPVVQTKRARRRATVAIHPRDFVQKSQRELDEEQMMLDAGIEPSEIVRRTSGQNLNADELF